MTYVETTDLAGTSTGQGAAMVGFVQVGTGATARRVAARLQDTVSVFDFMTTTEVAAVKAGTSTNDTAKILLAIESAATDIFMPPGTYRVQDLSVLSGKRLRGAGIGRTIVKIATGSTGKIFGLAGRDGVEISDMTIDGSDANDDNNHGLFLSSCSDAVLKNIEIMDTGGSGVWAISCPRLRADNITVKDIADQNSWAFHVQGPNGDGAQVSNIRVAGCNTRAVMFRDVDCAEVNGVTCSGNLSTAMWFQNCNWSIARGIVNRGDTIGDTVVIEGDCIGTRIIGAASKTSGGHGASIAANALYDAPQDCHISDCYFEDQGECLAAISDQGAGVGFTITNCSITNVTGRNCGLGNGAGTVPSPAFAFTNAQNCTITGRVLATSGSMIYAVEEQSGSGTSANNRCEIDYWVAGTSGYVSLASSISMVTHAKLDSGGFERLGDANLSWNPGTHRRHILVDQAALTAERTITLSAAWANLEVLVTRVSAGAFNLLAKNAGGTTLRTMASANTWARFKHDGSNWNVIAAGTL